MMKRRSAMSFLAFLLLFVVVCGWLDGRINGERTAKGAQ
ncbi:MAG: hypothetical protein OJF49_002843 [Ktedonobacterales bacterium]|nr:MAG: hypothetical protein OJF49_002843 [Ktedonobacterales bacterium]